MIVEILNLSGIDVAKQAAWVCRHPYVIEDNVTMEKAGDILIKCIEKGHWSVLEHITVSFFIDKISRACSHQLVRHRMASYTQTSQRFVGLTDMGFKIPMSIHNAYAEIREAYEETAEKIAETFTLMIENGIPQEDARFILPNAAPTTLVMTANLRSLANFFSLRMCKNAQWEIRELATNMYKLLYKKMPDIMKYFGRQCKSCNCDSCREVDNEG